MSAEGVCTFCPDGEFSDGAGECKQCPLHTVARKALSFREFHVVPDRFSTGCIKTSGGEHCYEANIYMYISTIVSMMDGKVIFLFD